MNFALNILKGLSFIKIKRNQTNQILTLCEETNQNSTFNI